MLPQLNAAPKTKTLLFWLGTNTCDGHIISFLNSCRPSFRELVEEHFNIYYVSFVMTAEGQNAVSTWSAVEGVPFILVVEGTAGMVKAASSFFKRG